MGVQFEWDTNKDALNQKKHGLSFAQAKALFTSGVEFLEIYDEEHSEEEDHRNWADWDWGYRRDLYGTFGRNYSHHQCEERYGEGDQALPRALRR